MESKCFQMDHKPEDIQENVRFLYSGNSMGVSEDYPQEMFVYVCVTALLKSGNIHCFLKRPQKKQLSKET